MNNQEIIEENNPIKITDFEEVTQDIQNESL